MSSTQPTTTNLSQCQHCGQLEKSAVPLGPCLGSGDHDFKPIDRSTLAKALGSLGGRKRTYATDEERHEARKESWRKQNEKRKAARNAETSP